MKFKLSVGFIVPILLFTACKKEYVVDIDPSFEGEWHSAPLTDNNGVEFEMYFIIEGENGIYGQWCELVPLGSNCLISYNGPARINKKKSKLYIGKEIGGQVIFDIDVPPHINSDGKWECTLTSRIYIKN